MGSLAASAVFCDWIPGPESESCAGKVSWNVSGVAEGRGGGEDRGAVIPVRRSEPYRVFVSIGSDRQRVVFTPRVLADRRLRPSSSERPSLSYPHLSAGFLTYIHRFSHSCRLMLCRQRLGA